MYPPKKIVYLHINKNEMIMKIIFAYSYRNLRLLLFAYLAIWAFGGLTIDAQTVTKTQQGVYIMNKEAKQFLSRGNAWGTAAVVDGFGIPVDISYYSNGKCSISFADSDGKLGSRPEDVKQGETEWAWTDFSTPTYYDVEGNDGTYSFKSSTGMLYVSENENDNSRVANGGVKNKNYVYDASAQFCILTREEHDAVVEENRMDMLRNIAMKDGVDLDVKKMADFESYLEGFEYKTDVTFDVDGAQLKGVALGEGWTSVNANNAGNAYSFTVNGSEFYQSANFFRKRMSGLKAGVYKLTLNGFMREGMAQRCMGYVDYDFSYAYIAANGCKENLMAWACDRSDDSHPNSMGEALTLFSQGKYLNTLYCYVGEDGVLDIEIGCPGFATNGQWVDFANLTLTAYTHSYVRNYPEKGNVYHYGDVNKDGKVDVTDVTRLVDALTNKDLSLLADAKAADVNKDGKVDKTDVDVLGTMVAEGAYVPFYDFELHNITVYAHQDNEENMAGGRYMINYTYNVDPNDVKLEGEVLKLNINLVGVNKAADVCIYSKGKKWLSGTFDYDTSLQNHNMENFHQFTFGYGAGRESDVVMVSASSSDKKVIAYLLPEGVKDGITVTVRTDNAYYTQDFEIQNLVEDEITFDLSKSKRGAWMATIPGNIYFTHLTLPGAHDAATSTISSEYSKCQSMNIADLLRAGVRALDLRPKGVSGVTADNMKIYHGISNTNVLFKTALSDVVSFLKEYPTETVFILIHDEAGNASTAWKNAVLTCIENVRDYVKVIDNNMLLDDCRGKMVIISRDNVGNTTLLGKCGWGSSFNDKTVFYGSDTNSKTPWTLVYQDEYETTNINTRIGQVVKLLDDHIKKHEYDSNYIFFNTTNIAWKIMGNNPAENASEMNPIFELSESRSISDWNGRLGIISGDFMGDANYSGDLLLNNIIKQNYRYVFRERGRWLMDNE